MSYFEEIKEAVMSATPGEDTRNYYRNQGIAIERERIIKLVKQWQEDLVNGDPYTTEELAQHRDMGYKDGFDYLIGLIKGDK